MALRSKALHHGRSLSLPSASHPSTSHFDENLCRAATSSSLSWKLNGVNSLYDSIDDLLLLPNIQQIISQESQEKWFDQVLDGYIKLMDACITAKDLLSDAKQSVQDLLSALRRKDLNGIQSYLASRKKSKKMIQKSLRDLRSFRINQTVMSSEKDNETVALLCMLKDGESVTISMLESLLSYVMGTKVQARKSGWSLVSKLVHSKKVSNQGDENEFEKVDAFLNLNKEDEEVMNHLKQMDSSIQNLEGELECLFRQLIKTRVTLLNILNN